MTQSIINTGKVLHQVVIGTLQAILQEISTSSRKASTIPSVGMSAI